MNRWVEMGHVSVKVEACLKRVVITGCGQYEWAIRVGNTSGQYEWVIRVGNTGYWQKSAPRFDSLSVPLQPELHFQTIFSGAGRHGNLRARLRSGRFYKAIPFAHTPRRSRLVTSPVPEPPRKVGAQLPLPSAGASRVWG